VVVVDHQPVTDRTARWYGWRTAVGWRPAIGRI